MRLWGHMQAKPWAPYYRTARKCIGDSREASGDNGYEGCTANEWGQTCAAGSGDAAGRDLRKEIHDTAKRNDKLDQQQQDVASA